MLVRHGSHRDPVGFKHRMKLIVRDSGYNIEPRTISRQIVATTSHTFCNVNSLVNYGLKVR